MLLYWVKLELRMGSERWFLQAGATTAGHWHRLGVSKLPVSEWESSWNVGTILEKLKISWKMTHKGFQFLFKSFKPLTFIASWDFKFQTPNIHCLLRFNMPKQSVPACYSCGKKGHFARACKTKQTRCGACGEESHKANYCQNRYIIQRPGPRQGGPAKGVNKGARSGYLDIFSINDSCFIR